MSVNYHEYIKSAAWRKRARGAKKRAKWRCQVCNKRGKHATLNAHHRTYERLGKEWPTDLTVLCRECHAIFSKRMPTEPDQTRTSWPMLFESWGLERDQDDDRKWDVYEYGKVYLVRSTNMTTAWYARGLRALAEWLGI